MILTPLAVFLPTPGGRIRTAMALWNETGIRSASRFWLLQGEPMVPCSFRIIFAE